MKQPSDSDYIRDKTECERHKTNHILHFLISVISIGAWLIVWLFISSSDTSARNDIHKKYGITQEPNNAGLFIVLAIGFVAVSFLIKS